MPARGLPSPCSTRTARLAVAGLVADGLVDGGAAVAERTVVLTRRGRLLADAVVRPPGCERWLYLTNWG